MILLGVSRGGDSRNMNSLGLELRNVLNTELELPITKLLPRSLDGNKDLITDINICNQKETSEQ